MSGLKEILRMDYAITHIHREGNMITDRLANMGVESRGCFLFDDVTSDLSSQIERDESHDFYVFRIL